jgi:hypothetical protein
MAKVPPWVWSGDSARLLTQNILVSGVTVSATELGYLDGVTSAIQTQIDSKTGIADNETITGNWTFNNIITGSITGNAGTVTNGVYTTGDQSIAGIKTFSSTIVGSISGNAGTVTNGVYTTGDQSIAGIKTFSSTIVGSISGNAGTVTNGAYINVTNSFTSTQNILATTNQLVLGTTNTTTISATAPASSAVYTIPDVGTTADFVLTAGAQTIGGAKTFSSTLFLSSSTSLIATDTSDAADNKRIAITGGGALSSSRGAYLFVAGNEFIGELGNTVLSSGAVTGSSVTLANAGSATLTAVGGNVGIGTASPGTLLHLKAPSGTTTLLLDTTAGATDSRIAFSEGSGTSNITFDLLYEGSAGLSPNNLFKLRASSTSNSTMDVTVLTANQSGAVTLGPDGGNIDHFANGTFNIVQQSSGGTPLTGYKKTATTTSALIALLSDVGGTAQVKFRVDADGDVTASGTISDLRAKKLVRNIPYGLTELLQLDPSGFRWNHEEDNAVEWFTPASAQKLQEIMPEMVREDGLGMTDENGQAFVAKAIYKDEILAVTVKAIQELHAELQTLKGA